MPADISALFSVDRYGDVASLHALWLRYLDGGPGAVGVERFRQWTDGDGAPRADAAIEALARALTERGRPTTAAEIKKLSASSRKLSTPQRLDRIEAEVAELKATVAALGTPSLDDLLARRSGVGGDESVEDDVDASPRRQVEGR